jgi:lysozyme family protein
MTQPSYRSLWPRYAKQWDTMTIVPARQHEFEEVAKKLLQPNVKAAFVDLEASSGVPWWMTLIIAEREYGGTDFSKGLAQGDPWNRRSVNEPICGPFRSWKAAALWSLDHEGFMNKPADYWRLEKVLWAWEKNNGWGYYLHGVPSAYVWSGSNIYKSGKYIHDGASGWRPNIVDVQVGCAPLLKMMMSIDSSISIVRED